jgi:lysophospholipase L1-like esterase
MSRSQKTILTALVLTTVSVFVAVGWLSFGETLRASVPIGRVAAPADDPDGGSITIWAIGDSLMVGSSDLLESTVPGIVIDAEVGRPMSDGIEVLEEKLATGIPDVLIVALGTNNGVTPSQIAQLMQLADDVDEVIFVNVSVPRPWETATNTAILRAASGYSNVTFVNWKARSGSNEGVFRSDGYHLTQTGNSMWVDAIVAEIMD